MKSDLQFSVVDETVTGHKIYSSKDFNLVLHEYLSIINNELKTLVRCGAKTKYEQLSFNHIYIIEEKVDLYKKYKYITNKFTFNLNTMELHGYMFSRKLDQSYYPINLVCTNIRNNVNMLINGSYVTVNKNYFKTDDNKEKDEDDIFKNTNKLLEKVNSSNKTSTRLIPTVEDSDDSDSSNSYSSYDSSCISVASGTLSDSSSVSYRKPSNSIKLKKKSSYLSDDVSTDSSIDSISLFYNHKDQQNLDTPSQLKKQMQNLKKIKEREEKRLNKIKEQYDDDMTNFSKYNSDINDQKRFERIDKERAEEKQRIFESDKNVYAKMKQHISEEKLDEGHIPELFAAKYPIFKFMDAEGILDEEDEYDTYLELYNELYPPESEENEDESEGEYIPHNYHYLNKEEQEKYKKPKKEYPSLEQVLDQISDDSDNEVTNNNDVLDKDYNFDNADDNGRKDHNLAESGEQEDHNLAEPCEQEDHNLAEPGEQDKPDDTLVENTEDNANTPSFIEDKINKVVSIINNST
jgi:hypothetical protein